MTWASIDPGLSACGVALWSDEGTLIHATLVKSKMKTKVLSERVYWLAAAVRRYLESPHAEPVEPVTTAIIEMPQTYKGRAARGDTNDLLNVALVVGALISSAKTVHLVRPSEWKGTVDADVMTARIRGKLTEQQKSRVDKLKNHNVVDALGIGLWWNEKNSLTGKRG